MKIFDCKWHVTKVFTSVLRYYLENCVCCSNGEILQNAQASSSTVRVHETSAEPVTKKLRKEVKSEFSEIT